jgi:serine/threonine protein kinase
MRRMDLPEGTIVDRYRIERPIGRGGLAVVYRVRHTTLGTLHALKVLALPMPAIRDRLVQEGRVQAQLKHPNVVVVTDVIDVNGSPGLVMELVVGVPLDRLLATRVLTIAQIDAVVRGIIAGVGAAHQRGLVHRDLKPANILLSHAPDGLVPKVTDFGMAKIVGLDATLGPHTRSGMTMGTPAYMAPEQYRNTKNVDARADIFALGAIFYEMATGRRAFPGEDLIELIGRVASGSISPLAELRPDLGPERIAAIEGALRVDPDARFADCAALWSAWSGDRTDSPESGVWTDVLATLPPIEDEETVSREVDPSPTWAGSITSDLEPPRSGPEPHAPTLKAPNPVSQTGINPAPARWWPMLALSVPVVGALVVGGWFAVGGTVDVRPPSTLGIPRDDSTYAARAVLEAFVPGTANDDLVRLTALKLEQVASESTAGGIAGTGTRFDTLRDRIAAHGLPDVVIGIPYAESDLIDDAVSSLCAGGPWQLMPETAANAGLRVEGCAIRGRAEPWTPAPGSTPRGSAPYVAGGACAIDHCAIDERFDFDRATEASLSTLQEVWDLDAVARHPQRTALTVLSWNAGLRRVLARLDGTAGGDAFAGIVDCVDGTPCGWMTDETAWFVPDVLAHAAVATCMAGPDPKPAYCARIPKPVISARAVLAHRSSPLLLGLAPLAAVGVDPAVARAADLKLAAALAGLPNLRVVPVDASADDPALAASLGQAAAVDLVLTGTIGQLGSRSLLNLQRVDVTAGDVTATDYREGADVDAVIAGLDPMLGGLLAANPQGMDVDQIREVIRARHDELKACYEAAVGRNPGTAGTVEVTFTVHRSGRVTDVSATDTTGDPALVACVTDEVTGWMFPANAVQAEVTWPFVFAQRGN